jgi:hypothetical protein
LSINKSTTALKTISRFQKAGIPLAIEVQVIRQYRRSTVKCPSCRSEKEMLFLALSMSFICDEPHCGYEVQVDAQEVEVLLNPEETLVYA